VEVVVQKRVVSLCSVGAAGLLGLFLWLGSAPAIQGPYPVADYIQPELEPAAEPAPSTVTVSPGVVATVPVEGYVAQALVFDGEGVPDDYVTCFFADLAGEPLTPEVLAERELPEYLVLPVDEVVVPLGHHLVCELGVTVE